MKKLTILLISLIIGSANLWADNKADDIVGNYEAESKGRICKVRIYQTGDTYTGQVYWVDEPRDENGNIKTDIKNPDPNLRKVPMSEVVLIRDIKFNGKNEWNGGTIYDPTRGKRFRVEVSLTNDKNTLKVRGKVGLFGYTVRWPRISK